MTTTELLLLILVAIVATAFVIAGVITWRMTHPSWLKPTRGLPPLDSYVPPYPGEPFDRYLTRSSAAPGGDPCIGLGERWAGKTDRIVLPISYVDPEDAKARVADKTGQLDTTPPKLLKVPPGKMIEIIQRPQNLAFRPERIVIGGNPADWLVHDIKVGNRSQFSQRGDVPGEVFDAKAQGTQFSFETVQTAMDFAIIVSYRGPNTEGDYFHAAVMGTAAFVGSPALMA